MVRPLNVTEDMIGEGVGPDTRLIGAENSLSFARAVARWGTDQGTIMIDNPESVAADLTIPANVNIVFTRGGRLVVAVDVTVTFDNPEQILADHRQRVFECLSQLAHVDGAVAFDNGGQLYAEWWGFGPANTAAVNAARFNAALAAAMESTSNLAFHGDAAAIPCGAIEYENASGSTMRGIIIEGIGKPTLDMSSVTANEAFKIWGTDSANRIETLLKLRNFRIDGGEGTDAYQAGTPAGTAIGLWFKYVMDLQLEGIESYHWHTGFRCYYVWPLRVTGCIFSYNYVGFCLNTPTNDGYIQSQFDQNYHNVHMIGANLDITFFNPLLQNAGGNAFTVQNNAANVCGLKILNPYLESVAGNGIVLGYDLAGNEGTGGAIFNVEISDGIWTSITGTPLVFPTGTVDTHGVRLLGLYGIDALVDIVGNPRRTFLLTGNTSLTDGIYYWDNARNCTRLLIDTAATGLGPSVIIDNAGVFGGGYVRVEERIKRVQAAASGVRTLWTKALDDDASYLLEADLIGRENAGAVTSAYKVVATAERDSGGNVTIIGNTVLVEHEDLDNALAFAASGTDVVLQSTQGGTAQYYSGYIRVTRIAKSSW